MKLHNYIHKSYRRQLQLYFIIASVIPLSVSGFILVWLFRYQAGRDLARSDLAEKDQIEATLLDTFFTVEEGIHAVEEEPDIAAALTNGKVLSSNVYAALYRETNHIRDFASVDIYSGGRRIYSTDSGSEARTLPTDFGILARAKENPDQVVYETGIASRTGSGAGSSDAGVSVQETCLQIAKKINDNDGYAVVTLRQDGLDLLLQGEYRGDEGILILNRFWEKIYGAGSLGTDETAQLLRGNILDGTAKITGVSGSEVSSAKAAGSLAGMPDAAVARGLDSNYYGSRLGSTGLVLVYLTPPALSGRIFQSMMTVVILFALLMIPLSLLFSSYVSQYLAKPIQTLDEGMKRFRHGDMYAHVDLDRDDEIGQLAEGFNKTTVRVRENMEEQLAQQKKLNETQIAMMQAQLNPHFLYNTLDTIKWVAKAHDVPEVAGLSQNLATLLRKSIQDAQFIPLSEELDIVESYCSIQEFRFDHSFSYECEVPQELMGAIVPKLILQPVVENAIIHGLEGVEDGLVKITAGRRLHTPKAGEMLTATGEALPVTGAILPAAGEASPAAGDALSSENISPAEKNTAPDAASRQSFASADGFGEAFKDDCESRLYEESGVKDNLKEKLKENILAGQSLVSAQDLAITVTDNGRGISDEMIAILRRHQMEDLSGHLGFRNVDTILRMFYGDDYGISASRRPEGGTKVILLMPLRMSDHKNTENSQP